jgi:hypothetical protein
MMRAFQSESLWGNRTEGIANQVPVAPSAMVDRDFSGIMNQDKHRVEF